VTKPSPALSDNSRDILRPPGLVDLAIASWVYTTENGADPDFWKREDRGFVLSRHDDATWLLGWLNRYGCRQFKKADHARVVRDLVPWWHEFRGSLPERGISLLQLDYDAITRVQRGYDALAELRACTRSNGVPATVGPVGAAKLLFALRPRALAPWDNATRERLETDMSVSSYSHYLLHVKDTLSSIAQECRERGFDVAEVPRRLGRSEVTLPKLVDEYYWLTIKRDLHSPEDSTLRQWLQWRVPPESPSAPSRTHARR